MEEVLPGGVRESIRAFGFLGTSNLLRMTNGEFRILLPEA